MFDAVLKATYSSFQKGMTFCRSIYVKKVMKLLAFIFEQPSYAFFLTFFLILKPFWSLIPKNCGNGSHNVTFLDVTSTFFPSQVPCLQFTLRNVAAKAGNRR